MRAAYPRPGAHNPRVRIASLVPSATEALCALGLGNDVVAVTHECDFPAEITALPRLTRSVIPEGLDTAEIDARVREVTGRGEALYELDEATLAELEPDLVVTQALCAVCAVSYDDVRAVAGRLASRPEVISLDPERLDEVLDDLVRLALAAAQPDRGETLRAELRARLDAVRAAVAGADRPRVAALEWLDPPFAPGHWVPEMIEIAGGSNAIGEAGAKSATVTWQAVRATRPEVAVVMPCGLYADEALAEAERHRGELEALGVSACHAVDAAASFSRPGPRLVDGVELLGHLLHPDLVAAPAGVGWRTLWADG
jgi:iron complex transport system substrate-binding protein